MKFSPLYAPLYYISTDLKTHICFENVTNLWAFENTELFLSRRFHPKKSHKKLT